MYSEHDRKPISQYIVDALISRSAEFASDTLHMLAREQGFKGFAFELQIAKALRGGPTVTYVKGGTSANLVFDASEIRRQQRDSEIGNLVPGTLVICYQNHPA